jgi:phosphatidate cytidylyltransferase
MSGLRQLSASQQVGLLFLLVFGALLLISAVALLRSLREHGEESRDRHERFKRELRALWIGASVFWLAWVSGAAGATLLFGVLSFLALR